MRFFSNKNVLKIDFSQNPTEIPESRRERPHRVPNSSFQLNLHSEGVYGF